MSGPAVPLSEHAARATASFARLLAEAEEGDASSGKTSSSGGHIDAAISPSLDDTLHKCDSQRKVYSPPYLLKFKEQFTETPKGLPPGLACLPSAKQQPRPERPSGGRSNGDRPAFRRGESARDVATLRLHRGRRGVDSVPARAGSPFSPRPKTPGSPTIPRWHRPESQEGPRGRTSAPSTPQQWKRAEEPPKVVDVNEDDEEEDFDPSTMEDDTLSSARGSWRRAEDRPLAVVPAAADGAKVWTPRRRQGAVSKEQELLGQVKGILNKLSVENFHQLCGQLFELEVPTLDVLKGIVDVIFDKATLEPTFSSLYAQLCADWANRAPKFQEPGSDRDMTFRRVLLNRCQVMFETKKKKKQKPEEGSTSATQEAPVKRVLIGNVIFIGELYRKKLITPKIIHICLSTLLTSITEAVAARKKSSAKADQQGEQLPLDEDVECLCKLFIIVGRDLDVSLGSDSRKRMEEYFRTLRGIMSDKSLPPRIRFLVQDVIEFRQAGWAHKTARSGK